MGLRATLALALGLVCSLGLLRGTSALFEDQAGTFDWYRQHVGLVSKAAFHPTKPRACVSTQAGILACLNLRDGGIAWRKRESTSSVPDMLLLEESQVLVSSTGPVLRGFDLEGYLKWERRLQGQAAHGNAALYKALQHGKAHLVYAQYGDTVKAYQASTGSEAGAWSLPLNAGDVVTLVVPTADGSAAFAATYSPGSTTVRLARLANTDDGEADQLQTAESGEGLSAEVVSSPRGFAALSSDASSVCVLSVAGGAAPQVACHALAPLASELPRGVALRLVATSTGYAVFSADPAAPGAALLAEGDGGALSLLRYAAAATWVTAEVGAGDSAAVGFLERTDKGSIKLSVVSSSTGSVVSEEEEFAGVAAPSSTALDGGPADVRLAGAVLGAFRKKDRTTGYRALVSLADGRSSLLQQQVVVWTRDEALSQVVGTPLFVDLPAPRAEAGSALAAATPAPDMKTRFRYQLLGAKVQLKLNTPAEAAELLVLRDALSNKNRPVRDVNGFRKMLLALTATGRLMALHNGDGRTLWSRAFPRGSAPSRLLPWRTYHDVTHAGEVLVLHEGDSAAAGTATVVNAHTGQQVSRTTLPCAVGRVVPLSEPLHEGSALQSVYLLVCAAADGASETAAPAVHVLPGTPAARGLVASSYKSLYFFEHEHASNELRGFGFTKAAAEALQAQGSSAAAATRMWTLAVPDPVLAMTVRDPTDPIQSSVKVLSDRSIKYKYLNPNLLFLATAPSTSSSDDSDSLSSEVVVSLVDTVTGRMLHRQAHAGARGPVSAVVSENLVLYFYWDIDAARFVATSMELFDATPGREFSVLDYLFNPNATKPVSSFTPTPLEVLSQSYFSRLAPTAATATRTEQGITSKQLLISTNTDQVYALDRRWVDPRRPKKQKLTQDEVEEGLLPYQDTLPLSPLSFATLDKQVLGLRGVVVEPTRLESTCLVLAHGVDLFYSRLAPAKGFDSLEDDFNYALLVTALVGLGLGAVALHVMVKNSALSQKWK